jgi:hypothetical protein
VPLSAALRAAVPWLTLAAPAALATAVWWSTYAATADRELGDLPVYAHAYRLMALGEVPYRDFRLEYPPLAAGLFWLAGALPGPYELGFAALMFACLLATIAGVHATARALGLGPLPTLAAGAVAALSPALLGKLVLTRYDLAVAALLAWLAWAVVRRRWTVAWLLMGVSVLVKLVPLALAPAALLAQARETPPRRAWRTWVPGAALVAAVLAPFAAAAVGGLWQTVAYHLDRPLQIESLGAAVLLSAHHLAGTPLAHVRSYGSDNLAGTAPDVVATLSGVVGVVLLAAVLVATWRALRRCPDARAAGFVAVQAMAATLTALVATGKVLSPQYLLWLVPLVPLVGSRRGPAAALVLAAAMWQSQQVFPTRYRALVEELAAAPVAHLVVRDLLLLGLVALVWPLAPSAIRRNTDTPSSWKTRRMSARA